MWEKVYDKYWKYQYEYQYEYPKEYFGQKMAESTGRKNDKDRGYRKESANWRERKRAGRYEKAGCSTFAADCKISDVVDPVSSQAAVYG